MRPETPLISVIIPVLNGAAYLAEAVASVRSQAYPALEILIVDDGSTDHTRDVALSQTPDCRYFYQENQGPPVARNLGLQHARGDLVALLDADDRWPSNKLDLQLPLLLADPDVDMVLGQTQYFRTHAATADTPASVEYVEPFFIIQIGCALFRRTLFDKVGGFDPSLRYGDDLDFLLRTREQQIKTRYVPEVTILYRRHTHNMTIVEGHESLSLMTMMKRSLDRRRAQGIDHIPLASWFE